MFEKTFWIVGGACTGKSTLSGALSESLGFSLIDMDARIYGTWQSVYSADKFPENYHWIQQSNALDWALRQSDDEYFGYCNRVSLEYFQLLKLELSRLGNQAGSIVDGGFSSLMPWVSHLDQANVVCLDVDRDVAVSEWNTDPDRVVFKQEIQALPSGEKKWIRFLELDALITSQLVAQAKDYRIPVINPRAAGSMQGTVDQVMSLWAVS